MPAHQPGPGLAACRIARWQSRSRFSRVNSNFPSSKYKSSQTLSGFADCVKDKFDVTRDIGVSVAERPGKVYKGSAMRRQALLLALCVVSCLGASASAAAGEAPRKT